MLHGGLNFNLKKKRQQQHNDKHLLTITGLSTFNLPTDADHSESESD